MKVELILISRSSVQCFNLQKADLDKNCMDGYSDVDWRDQVSFVGLQLIIRNIFKIFPYKKV